VNAYALLWELIKHVLHGRGRDEVCVTIDGDDPDTDPATGSASGFRWEGDVDAFCVIEAVPS